MPDSRELPDRLKPDVLRADAYELLSNHQGHEADLVIRLLRSLRLECERSEHIRDGYSHSYELSRSIAQQLIASIGQDISREILRDMRRGPSAGTQDLWASGMRRAAAIAKSTATIIV